MTVTDMACLLSSGMGYKTNSVSQSCEMFVLSNVHVLRDCRRSWRRRMKLRGLTVLVRRLVPPLPPPPVSHRRHEKNRKSTRITCDRPVSSGFLTVAVAVTYAQLYCTLSWKAVGASRSGSDLCVSWCTVTVGCCLYKVV